jgi:hypothetical protein
MQIGVAIGRTLPFEQQTELAVEAAKLGFDYITTNETPGETDAFQICLMRWLAAKDAVPGGLRMPAGETLMALVMRSAWR